MRRCLRAALAALIEAVICCLLLFVGLALNTAAAEDRDAAAYNATLTPHIRIELRARHEPVSLTRKRVLAMHGAGTGSLRARNLASIWR